MPQPTKEQSDELVEKLKALYKETSQQPGQPPEDPIARAIRVTNRPIPKTYGTGFTND